MPGTPWTLTPRTRSSSSRHGLRQAARDAWAGIGDHGVQVPSAGAVEAGGPWHVAPHGDRGAAVSAVAGEALGGRASGAAGGSV
ncbi:hypothetical protein [Streptomyces sp. MI02-7b]|uniref:hypothetical protein n=1 Tax=Streptomyces sp. MI02-7b TaxID=462941 RepID=UPI0029AB472F|nr:hypothetical protein [Streptomyces sp. MI02-7b]MDX3072678.1 hypothetical protein [Streptomyces sp. MI02-7b]